MEHDLKPDAHRIAAMRHELLRAFAEDSRPVARGVSRSRRLMAVTVCAAVLLTLASVAVAKDVGGVRTRIFQEDTPAEQQISAFSEEVLDGRGADQSTWPTDLRLYMWASKGLIPESSKSQARLLLMVPRTGNTDRLYLIVAPGPNRSLCILEGHRQIAPPGTPSFGAGCWPMFTPKVPIALSLDIGHDRNAAFYGVAADGVDSVALEFPDGQKIDAPVRNNAFFSTLPEGIQPIRSVAHMSDGSNVVDTLPPAN